MNVNSASSATKETSKIKKKTENRHDIFLSDVKLILNAEHPDPFGFLGAHPLGGKGKRQRWQIRCLQAFAQDLKLILKEKGGKQRKLDFEKIDNQGFFVCDLISREKPIYELEIIDHSGNVSRAHDPYSFEKILGEQDMYFFAEGTHRIYDKYGAHVSSIAGVHGATFTVWAPNAKRVSLVGDFNRWDGRMNPMRKRVEAGIWEIFIPEASTGMHYKYEIVGADNRLFLKSDPLAFFSQNRSDTASILWDRGHFIWSDAEWIEKRKKANPYKSPISIYEVHLGSWQQVPEENNRQLSYRELAERLIPHVKELGFTHIELMPITEYPLDASWGYQATGYFAPTSRHGDPDDFKFFVDACHQVGIGVLLDWAPAHFPSDAHGLARFDGTCLYEHEDPRLGEHKDWGSLIFNYGRNEVRNFLISSALYWLDEFHIDGLRVDAVASMLYLDYSREEGEWIANEHGGRENLAAIEFLRMLNEKTHLHFPGILMFAEESTAWGGVSKPTSLGGLGFGFKWNMGWMNDMLTYIQLDPIHRKHHHGEATFSMIYSFDENFILVLSHDEVVHGKRSLLNKMPGDNWQKFANLRLFYAWMFAHPGKKLLFMGAEIAQWNEWNFQQSLDWHLLQYPDHAGIRQLLQDLNHLYRSEAALHFGDHDPASFSWIEVDNWQDSIFSFTRRKSQDSTDDDIYVIVNATPVVRHNYCLSVALGGVYREIFNSDSKYYAGSNTGNCGDIHTFDRNGGSAISVTLPPLAAIFIKKS